MAPAMAAMVPAIRMRNMKVKPTARPALLEGWLFFLLGEGESVGEGDVVDPELELELVVVWEGSGAVVWEGSGAVVWEGEGVGDGEGEGVGDGEGEGVGDEGSGVGDGEGEGEVVSEGVGAIDVGAIDV